MNKRVERLINNIYKSVFKKVFNNENIKKGSQKGNKHEVEEYIIKLKNSKQYKKFAEEFSKRLAQAGISNERGLWKKYYKAAKENHIIALPTTYKEFEINMMKEAVKHNFKLIKTIPDKIMNMYQNKYIDTLIEQVAKGKIGRNGFKNELLKHGAKNANVIARTETSKLQTFIMEKGAKDLGSVAYRWKSSNDIRTRPSHKEMNRVIVFWRPDTEKPLRDNMRGNAGEFPNCRCYPEAIFDESDLKENNYKVYDYKNDKIINMSKKELLYYINKGEL